MCENMLSVFQISVWFICLMQPTISSFSDDLHNCHLNVSGDDSLQFDFSSLSENGWNEIKFTFEGKDFSLFLSICPNLVGKKRFPCSTSTYVCVMERVNGVLKEFVTDAGSSSISRDFDGSSLVMSYEGSKCRDDKNFTTAIRFHCSDSDENERFVTFEDCDYVIYWETTAACPVQEVVVEDTCILAQNSHSFDLRSLRHKTAYIVERDSDVYYVNICSSVKHSQCSPRSSVCLYSKSYRVVSLTSGSLLKYSLQKGLSLEYKNNEGNGKTVIFIECSEGITKPELKFISEEDGVLKFAMLTTVACIPPPVNCEVSQDDSTYYLSVLHKHVDNWEIPSPKTGKKYLINICGGLNSMPGVPCTGGSVAACLWDPVTNEGINLGSRERDLTIKNVGIISLRYTNGAPCGKGRYSLKLELLCSSDSLPPKVSSENCEHNIVWYTDAACPLKFARGKDCQLKEENNNYKFNFSLLHKVKDDYVERLKNGEAYRTNLCGPLVHQCNKEKNVGVCWVDSKGKQFAIGRVSQEPIFTNGKLTFSMVGEPCEKNVSKSVVNFEMICDYTGTQAGPQFITKSGKCEYLFKWKTDVACVPRRMFSCVLKLNNITYDLSSLCNPAGNHMVDISNTRGSRSFKNTTMMIINICQTLVPGPDSFLCPPNSASCLVDRSSPTQPIFKSLGRIDETDTLVVEAGTLRLRYRNGDICKDGAAGTIQTTIEFICDTAAHFTTPILKSMENCVYKVQWKTSAACHPNNQWLETPSTVVTFKEATKYKVEESTRFTKIHSKPVSHPAGHAGKKDCTVTSPSSKTMIDLSSLKKEEWIVKGVNESDIMKLSVCRQLDFSCPIAPTSGLCYTSGTEIINLGEANGELKFREGLVYLTYNGPGCSSAEVEFRCGKEDTGPFLVQKNNCSTLITWQTPLVCHDELSKLCCRGEESPLCQLHGNYVVNIGDKRIILSVCHPLEPIEEFNCPRGSSACMATLYRGVYINGTSLGYPFVSPVVHSSSSIFLEYFRGDRCPNKPNENYSSSIHFTCDEDAGRGHPEYIDGREECHVNFQWKTSLLCKKEENIVNYTACSLSDTKASAEKVLSQFRSLSDMEVTSKSSGIMYKVNLCKGKMSECPTDVCIKKEGIWEPLAAFSELSTPMNKLTEVKYKNVHSHSSKRSCSIRVLLECDSFLPMGKPKITSESDCNVTIVWESQLACLNESVPINSVRHEETSSSSTTSIVILVLLAGGVIFAVSIFLLKMFMRKSSLRNTIYGQFRYSRKRSSSGSPVPSANEESSVNELLFSL